MSRRERVRVELNSGGITSLSDEEIRAILRGADPLIAVGGRNLLAKILKGSRDRKLLEHGLDQCPVYGYYSHYTLQEIAKRVDWMIEEDYLRIEYPDRLPVLVFSPRGWEIERETYAEELLHRLAALLDGSDYRFVQELKDRNRGMILLLIAKIKATGDVRFIPVLQAWKDNEYKKVQAALQSAIDHLSREP